MYALFLGAAVYTESTFAAHRQMSVIGDSVLRDLDIDTLVKSFPTQTAAGANILTATLSAPTNDKSEIQARQARLRTIKTAWRQNRQRILEHLDTLKQHEADVEALASARTDERHKEWYEQILWSPTGYFSWFNTFGNLTEIILAVRGILLPALSAILPLMIFVAPFVGAFLKQETLTTDEYFRILSTAIKRALPIPVGRFSQTGGALALGEQIVSIGGSIAMFAASIWSQISAAINLHKVAADMRKRACAVRSWSHAVNELADLINISLPSLPTHTSCDMTVFGKGWNDPDSVRQIITAGGELDALIAVARIGRVCQPTMGNTVYLKDLWHPGLRQRKPVYNTVDLRGHMLLTGPNRGGKSTLLKAVGCAALMHQSLGCVLARKATLPVFERIETALVPQDTLGKVSLFEAEIDFAKKIIDSSAEQPTLLLMDEIFHGTNAHDGVEAAKVFLDWLYNQTNIWTIISTHYLELPDTYATKASAECMWAESIPGTDRLRYSYKLRPGVNRFSSVREILRERGLLR